MRQLAEPALLEAWRGLTLPDFESCAQRFGTPYYLYDADEIIRRVKYIRDCFQGIVKVYYSIKANPNLELLRSLRGVVDRLDASSAGEIDQAIFAGYRGSDICIAGPAKSDSELSTAIRENTGLISAESVRELKACARLATG